MAIDPSIYQGATLANPAGAFLQGVQLAQQQKAQQQLASERQQEMRVREQQLASGEQESQLRGLQIGGIQRQQQGQQALAEAIKQYSDPQTGQMNHQAIANAVSQAGFPDQGEAWLKMASANAESLDKLQTLTRTHQQQQLATLGDLAFSATTPQEFTANIGLAAAHGLIDEQTAHEIAASAAGDGWQQIKAQYQQYSPRYQTQQAELRKPTTLKDGEKIVIPATGATVASAPDKQPNSEKAEFELDGKVVPGDYLPGANGQPGKYFYNGQDVTARVKAKPPAAMIVNNAAGKETLPPWATDASRPAGTDANAFDASIGMTPNGLYQAAVNYIQTGQFPQTGRGSQGRVQATRDAIQAKVGAIAAESGMDVPSLRAFFTANKGSLTAQQKLADSAQSFMATADKNQDLLKPLLAKLPDTGSPLLNQPLRAFEQRVMGNKDMAPIATYLRSVTNEYAKIISSPNLSGQLTDSARAEAETLLKPDATVQQILGSLDALRAEGSNRLVSVAEQIKRIQGRMQIGGGPSASTSSPAPPVKPTGRFNPATGKVEPVP